MAGSIPIGNSRPTAPSGPAIDAATRLRADQVSQVRGYADQKLRDRKDPLESSNRRITLIVQYMAPAESDEEPARPPEEPVANKKPDAHE